MIWKLIWLQYQGRRKIFSLLPYWRWKLLCFGSHLSTWSKNRLNVMHVNQHRKYKTVIKITFDLRWCSCGKVNKKIASHPCWTDDVFELLCLRSPTSMCKDSLNFINPFTCLSYIRNITYGYISVKDQFKDNYWHAALKTRGLTLKIYHPTFPLVSGWRSSVTVNFAKMQMRQRRRHWCAFKTVPKQLPLYFCMCATY